MTRPGKFFKIETKCKNVFRRNSIENNVNFEMQLIIKGLEKIQNIPKGFKFSETIGSSYCNLMSWKIQRLIEKENLKTKLVFLHIPKNSDKEVLLSGINTIIHLYK